MCGLAGFLAPLAAWPGDNEAGPIAAAMRDALRHRGPDDAGSWLDGDAGIALGFRRLAILDLSEQGHQPMQSACGRYVIAFNGEIYNHLELRKQAEHRGAMTWRGHSDTETILAWASLEGVRPMLDRLSGMFAIALWDRQERRLWLARDRLGEKPLYWAKIGGILMFGSELKALRAHPAFRGEIDPGAAAAFLRYGFIPDPLSIYAHARKLRPGQFISVQAGETPEPEPYWDAAERLIAARTRPFAGDRVEALGEVRSRMKQAVADRLISDRPIGAFLSGGIDSSNVVAQMAAAAPSRVRTFTIGFGNKAFDESPYAEAVAAHLRTDHTTFHLTEADCLDSVPHLARTYDEPFADSSQIPTYLLCRQTASVVTVALSGDGGDEMFGGYPRYRDAPDSWDRAARIPPALRQAAGLLGDALGDGRLNRRLKKSIARIRHADADSLYRDHLSRWRPDEGLYDSAFDSPSAWDAPLTADATILSLPRRFMLRDLMVYLPGDLLVKMDRASMAHGLEVRAPLLDHCFVEFVWSLPDSFTVADGKKGLLRAALAAEMPDSLFERPKRGFEPPLVDWLRGGLRGWAESLLGHGDSGLYDKALARRRWREHLSGRRAWTYPLWNVLMLEAWLKEWA
jgi:asparagine synthase (glutamine-hydrolysing)